MTHLLATATAAAVLASLVYAAACAVAPFRVCRTCAGTRERRNMLGQTRPCWRCHGEGHRPRLGRRAYNHLARLRREGTRTR